MWNMTTNGILNPKSIKISIYSEDGDCLGKKPTEAKMIFMSFIQGILSLELFIKEALYH